MKKRLHVLTLIFLGMTILLEAYPKSVILSRIATPEEHFIDYYSYFNLTPYWNENKYLLYTGILSLVLFILSLLEVLTKNKNMKLNIATLIIGIIAIIMSIMTVICSYERKFGITISIFLILAVIFSMIKILEKDNKNLNI